MDRRGRVTQTSQTCTRGCLTDMTLHKILKPSEVWWFLVLNPIGSEVKMKFSTPRHGPSSLWVAYGTWLALGFLSRTITSSLTICLMLCFLPCLFFFFFPSFPIYSYSSFPFFFFLFSPLSRSAPFHHPPISLPAPDPARTGLTNRKGSISHSDLTKKQSLATNPGPGLSRVMLIISHPAEGPQLFRISWVILQSPARFGCDRGHRRVGSDGDGCLMSLVYLVRARNAHGS